MIKAAFLAGVALLGLSHASSCDYDCSSYYPALYGRDNLGAGGFGLPRTRVTGFSPKGSIKLCEEDFEVTSTLIPLPTISDNQRLRSSSNFVAVCPGNEKKLKLFSVNEDDSGFFLKAAVDVGGEGDIIGFSEVRGDVFVLTEKSLSFYQVSVPIVDSLELKWTFSLDSGSFSGVPLPSTNSVVAFTSSGAVSVSKDFDISGNVLEISNGILNKLEYGVSSGNNVAYCSESGLNVVDLSSGATDSVDLSAAGLSCTALIASAESTLTFAATTHSGSSVLATVDTSSLADYTVFGTYDGAISTLSREAWKEAGGNRVALLVTTTDSGVMTVVEEMVDVEKGAIYSHFDTAHPVTGKPLVTDMAEPVVFTEDGVVAFSKTFTTKFFPAQGIESDFVASPLMLGQTRVLAVTVDGTAVLWTYCNRFKLGEEEPDDSCPFAELPEVEEVASWMTILAGAGAVVAIPFFGEYACVKMKICGGHEEEDDDDIVSEADLTARRK